MTSNTLDPKERGTYSLEQEEQKKCLLLSQSVCQGCPNEVEGYVYKCVTHNPPYTSLPPQIKKQNIFDINVLL